MRLSDKIRNKTIRQIWSWAGHVERYHNEL